MERDKQIADRDGHTVRDENGDIVAVVYKTGTGTATAHGKLIAAAPELLEACLAVMSSAYQLGSVNQRDKIRKTIVEPAIAKALGR